MQADGPVYSKQLQKEVHIAAEGLRHIGFTASISDAFTVQEKGIGG
jgi:hypothetical protein